MLLIKYVVMLEKLLKFFYKCILMYVYGGIIGSSSVRVN